jgi:hypothetical protein
MMACYQATALVVEKTLASLSNGNGQRICNQYNAMSDAFCLQHDRLEGKLSVPAEPIHASGSLSLGNAEAGARRGDAINQTR